VFEAAEEHGLKLAKGGRLIDTSSGEYELKDVELEDALDVDQLARLKTPPLDLLQHCVARAGETPGNPSSKLASDGVEEAGVIVPQATRDGFAPGPISGWWPHGFNLRELRLETGAYVPSHARAEAEVLLVQSGTIEVSWNGGAIVMGAGDTLSVPIALPHAFRNTASASAVVFIVRGTEDPALPIFETAPLA
jgi:mannose-6-phosphate isomerase-like protein (cupin superfamily)